MQNEESGEKENQMELYAFRVGKIWYPKWKNTDQGHESEQTLGDSEGQGGLAC